MISAISAEISFTAQGHRETTMRGRSRGHRRHPARNQCRLTGEIRNQYAGSLQTGPRTAPREFTSMMCPGGTEGPETTSAGVPRSSPGGTGGRRRSRDKPKTALRAPARHGRKPGTRPAAYQSGPSNAPGSSARQRSHSRSSPVAWRTHRVLPMPQQQRNSSRAASWPPRRSGSSWVKQHTEISCHGTSGTGLRRVFSRSVVSGRWAKETSGHFYIRTVIIWRPGG